MPYMPCAICQVPYAICQVPYMPYAICQVPITSHAPCTIIWDQKILGKENAKESIFTFSVYFWFCEDWTNKIIWGPRASQPPSSSQCCRPSPPRDNSGFACSPCGFSSACADPSTGCRSRSCTTNLHCTCPRNFLRCCYRCHGPWAEVMGKLFLKLSHLALNLIPSRLWMVKESPRVEKGPSKPPTFST